MKQENIHDIVDYIILKMSDTNASLSLLKLQKLLYYVQSWHLAFYKTPLFNGKFQAWVHGPVNREIFDRFKETHILYSDVIANDLHPNFNPENLEKNSVNHINSVLDAYASFAGYQLEELTHKELPWLQAREGYSPSQRCEIEIDEKVITDFYSSKSN